ncbi:MAG: ADP-ribosylglycohydrolase family protein [Planctomycetes bacterium]|nr:ADP-ribosylglycohydrolase family protein [Planctomycetota bacterium]MBL7041093.1 ADP-ribosylglycohydrolase family protein [Pirellulaceae bacterium]
MPNGRASMCVLLAVCITCVPSFSASVGAGELRLSRSQYEDRVHAVWAGQVIGMLLAYPFEHRVGSVTWVDDFRQPTTWEPLDADCARVDDDWYYEIVALRGFERHGIEMTVEQLGQQWVADSAGSWGSSAQTRRLLAAGVKPPDTGHPRYNPLWYTIGPQFSADIYGAIAPGMPKVAGRLARNLGHIHGYAEGTDGAVFVAGMVSIAFAEKDPRQIVRKAATLIHPSSPYRQCLDMIIDMAEDGATFEKIARAIGDRWHIEYPATNNAVANGGFIAAGVWFGEGDLLKTVNLISQAADFTDADCNAANAGAVVGAMHGTKCLPRRLFEQLNDRIQGDKMGPVTFAPPVDERISDLARRTAAIGEKILDANGARVSMDKIFVPLQEPATQEPERFRLSDLMQYWNPDWELHGAGFGFRGGVRGTTFLEADVLATYPRDEVRGVSLRRSAKLSATPMLSFDVGVDGGRVWRLEVWVNNQRIDQRLVEGDQSGRKWEQVRIDLTQFAGQQVHLRLYQFVLFRNKRPPGTAYWRNLTLR